MIDTTKIGGAERMAVNIANSLVKTEQVQSFLIISRSEGLASSQLNDNVVKFILGKRSSLDVGSLLKLINWLRQHEIELLHAHSSSIVWALLSKWFLPNLVVVYHDHLGDRNKAPKGFNKAISFLSKKCDGYIGVTEKGIDWAQRNLSNKRLQTILLGNYPVINSWDNDTFDKISKLKGSPTFLLIGNYRKEKNHELAIKAFSKVLQTLPESKLWFIGKAIQPLIKENVLQKINEYGIEEHCIDFGEIENVFPYIEAADIGIFSSTFEGTPVSLLEFGIMGKTVVSTNVGRNSEIIGKVDKRLVVESGNADSFADALVFVGKNESLQKEYGKKLKHFVHEEFGEARVINELLEFYKGLTIND